MPAPTRVANAVGHFVKIAPTMTTSCTPALAAVDSGAKTAKMFPRAQHVAHVARWRCATTASSNVLGAWLTRTGASRISACRARAGMGKMSPRSSCTAAGVEARGARNACPQATEIIANVPTAPTVVEPLCKTQE